MSELIKLIEECNVDDIAKILQIRNDVKYNKMKSSEEFQELALALTQQVLKPTKVKDQEIIDEIGDCIIRLSILIKIYDLDKIRERLNYKVTTFNKYVTGSDYDNI